MANRPPARDVGWLLTFVTYAELLENNLEEPTKLTTEKLNCTKPEPQETTKMYLPNSTTFLQKKVDCDKLAAVAD